jgi:hypothetical protein
MPFTESELAIGDWIKFRDDHGGVGRIAEINSLYPFGTEPMADTTLGLVKLSAVIEARRQVCDRDGEPKRVVDESGDVTAIKRFPAFSVCGKPQVG